MIEEFAEGIHPQGIVEQLREGGDFGAGARPMQPETPHRHPR